MLLALEDADTQSYDYLLRRLAVESTTTSNVFSIFKNIIPKSAEAIRSYLPSLNHFVDTKPEGQVKYQRPRQLVLNAMMKMNFVAYEDTLVFVPEGFNGKLVPYLELLLDQSKLVMSHGLSVLQDYNTELSMFLSNKDIRQSLKSHEQHYRKIRHEREDYQKAVEQFFDKKNPTLSRRRIKDVLDRFSDLDKVYVYEQKLEAVQKNQNYKTIIAEVQKAADMLMLIKARLDSGDISEVSGQTAKNIAEGAFEVAKFAEYMALYGYFVENALAAIRNTSDQLAELTKS